MDDYRTEMDDYRTGIGNDRTGMGDDHTGMDNYRAGVIFPVQEPFFPCRNGFYRTGIVFCPAFNIVWVNSNGIWFVY
jgi:hypothetical protein